MMGADDSIPEPLLRRLEDARLSLERNASVRERSDGGTKHRAMPLGGRNIALAVKRLLDSWREEHKEREKAAAHRLLLDN